MFILELLLLNLMGFLLVTKFVTINGYKFVSLISAVGYTYS